MEAAAPITTIVATPDEIRKRMNQMDVHVLDDVHTHKIYPFVLSTVFQHNGEYNDFESGYLIDHYTGEVYTGNGGYYSGFVVFYSATDYRYCAGFHYPDYLHGILFYQEQIYGFAKPFEIPQIYQASLVHVIAYTLFGEFYHGKSYKLNKYKGKRFTVKEAHQEFGDVCELNGFGTGLRSKILDYGMEANNGTLRIYERDTNNTIKEFKIASIVTALNDILNLTHQLSLF